jgi:hypothetical protein
MFWRNMLPQCLLLRNKRIKTPFRKLAFRSNLYPFGKIFYLQSLRYILLETLLSPECGSDFFSRNVGWLSIKYIIVYPQKNQVDFNSYCKRLKPFLAVPSYCLKRLCSTSPKYKSYGITHLWQWSSTCGMRTPGVLECILRHKNSSHWNSWTLN